MGAVREVSATEINAKCLDLLEQVSSGTITRLEVTKRRKVVALDPGTAKPAGGLLGFLRGSVQVTNGVDVRAPVTAAGCPVR